MSVKDNDKSELDLFFDESILDSSTDPDTSINDITLIEDIKKIGLQERVHLSEKISIFEYYRAKSSMKPHISELAHVVFAAPCSQVTVERSFSTLAVLLKCHRMNMLSGTIDNILMCNLNSDLFATINFEEL